MVSPDAFDVKYAINPHMLKADGSLNVVDRMLAHKQWENVKLAYEKLGFTVDVLAAHQDFPDMVFCANQAFPFLDSKGVKSVLLSHMAADQRKGEVPIFEKWFRERGYRIVEVASAGALEGSGDLLWDFEMDRIFAGYGYRTDIDILDEVEELIGHGLIRLELRDSRYYHLDTCLAILNSKTASIVREAFTSDGLLTLRASFQDLIELDSREAEQGLAGNAHCPNGRDVLIQSGCVKTNEAFRQRDFIVHEVDTSEFLKSGGSVFCMKQMIY